MNFYKRHIGDYLKDTAHLSLLEHGVYTRLLDVYYTREAGIPEAQAARLIGARSKDECAALETVLSEFFTMTDGLWVQQRCEREIEDAAEGETDRDTKRENERERQRRHRDRRRKLFDELRKHDVIPPYDTSTEQLQSLLSRVTNDDWETQESQHVTQPVTRDATANQTPDSRLQTPEEKPSAPSEKISLDAGGEWVGIPEKLSAKWSEAYPAVNVPAELAKASAWIMANPKNRKSNYARFLTNWLTRAQDNARPAKGMNGGDSGRCNPNDRRYAN